MVTLPCEFSRLIWMDSSLHGVTPLKPGPFHFISFQVCLEEDPPRPPDQPVPPISTPGGLLTLPSHCALWRHNLKLVNYAITN